LNPKMIHLEIEIDSMLKPRCLHLHVETTHSKKLFETEKT